MRMIFVGGASKSEVAKVLGVSETSVRNWYRAYVEGGERMDVLDARKHTGRPPRMTSEQLDRLGNMLLLGAERYGYEVDLWTWIIHSEPHPAGSFLTHRAR